MNHQGQFPAVTLSFNLAPGYSLGDAVDAIKQAEAEIGDAGEHPGAFQGTAQAFQASLANEPILILAALVTVYIVLGFCTKVTSTRSRFFRRCPRPASARSWRL